MFIDMTPMPPHMQWVSENVNQFWADFLWRKFMNFSTIIFGVNGSEPFVVDKLQNSQSSELLRNRGSTGAGANSVALIYFRT